mmetsp:Transcript_40499/g.73215  ORF Transcript_40499/g.73215 Transcript_40499/m.73215 type:complete len:420 (-) Transcript_40499:116-1375(-)
MWCSCIPDLLRLRRVPQVVPQAVEEARGSKDVAALSMQESEEHAEGLTSTDSDIRPTDELSEKSSVDQEMEEGSGVEAMKDECSAEVESSTDVERPRVEEPDLPPEKEVENAEMLGAGSHHGSEVDDANDSPRRAAGSTRVVEVHLPSGKPVFLQDARTVAEARCQVAAACAVCPTQVQICVGSSTLSSPLPLRLDDIKEGLTAVIQTQPVEAAVICQGAGVFCLKYLSPERCMHIRSSSQLVKLPKGVRRRDWIAAHTCRVHQEIATIPARLGDMCTPDTCPRMDAGAYRYTWTQQKEDGEPVHVELCAPEYMRRAISQLQSTLLDDEKFPSDLAQISEEDFRATVGTILKRAFSIYAHVYHSHMAAIEAADPDFLSCLNFCFKHLVYFVLEFELLERQDLDPLRGYVHHLEDMYFAA